MPDGQQIPQTLMAPLAVLEDLLRTSAQALREGMRQFDQVVQGSGLPKVPSLPEPPKVFRR